MKTRLPEICTIASMQGVILGRGRPWLEASCHPVVCSVKETTNIRGFITAFVGVFS